MSAQYSTRGLYVAAAITICSGAFAQNWTRPFAPEPTMGEANPILRWVKSYEAAYVALEELEQVLKDAPEEILGLPDHPGVELRLPMPDGTIQRFRVWQNDILGEQVRNQVPDQRVFAGQGIDDPTAILRCELGYGRFTAMVRGEAGTFLIEPLKKSMDGTYFVYSKEDSLGRPGWSCNPDPLNNTPLEIEDEEGGLNTRVTGTNLWTFRLALNATGEYVTAVGAGNTTTATSKMITSVNRVDGVYRVDFAVRLNLTYTKACPNAATDPYTNSSGSTMLGQNQTETDTTVGNANYDIGHVFSTGGGGIAGLGVVGVTGQKARGVTGLPNPQGDIFDIDYVAHEMGHQFNGPHTFNGITGNCGGGNRSATNAFEPGSGSTIMAYAGICGSENVQATSSPYFHIRSIQSAMVVRIAARGGVATASGNGVPTVNAGVDRTIPVSTPFRLTGSGTDPNGHTLTFNWEQNNAGGVGGPMTTAVTETTRTLFRSLNPTLNGNTRFFPTPSLILANNYINQFEFLPHIARTLNMRLVGRDNQSAGGGVNFDEMVITASGTTPFAVTSPNTAITWNRNQTFNVTWDNAATNVAPFNVSNVNIYLSTDGGNSYFNGTAIPLAMNTPNDGSQTVSMPLSTTAVSTARVFVEAAGNIFFDVSNVNFTIASANTLPSLPVISNQVINEEQLWTWAAPAGTDPDTAQTLSYSLVGLPPVGVSFSAATRTFTWTPTEAQGPGNYPVTLRVSDNAFPTPGTFDRTFSIVVNEVPKLVNGTATLQFWVPSPSGQSVTMEFRTPTTANTLLFSRTVNLNGSSQYSVNAELPNGSYRLYLTKPKYLRKLLGTYSVSTATVNVPGFTMIAGDVDNSNEIDAADIDLVIANFGDTNINFDVDGSGEIDAADIDIVISNFGSVGD